MGATHSSFRAGIYVRISQDKTGEGIGVDRQEADCRALCERNGWEVTEVYRDNDLSAHKTTVVRPAYRQMVADIEGGKVNAVVAWHLDRLHRQPRELEDFINLADRTGIKLATVAGNVDLGTSDGRLHARIMGSVAAQESEHKSERIRAALAKKVQSGKPVGGVSVYGYRMENGNFTVVPAEAAVLRELVERFIAGSSIMALTRWLNAENIPTKKGARQWASSAVRKVLRNPRVAGINVHKGEVVGEGVWEPIITREQHELVCARLKANADAYGTNSGKVTRYLLHGFLFCDDCGVKLSSFSRPGAYRCYRCWDQGAGCTLTIKADLIENVVLTEFFDLFALRSENFGHVPHEDRAELARLMDHRGALLARRDDLQHDYYVSGAVDKASYTTLHERINEQIEGLNISISQLTHRASVGVTMPSTYDELVTKWDDADFDWKRAVLGSYLKSVRISRAQRRGPRQDVAARVADITWL